MSTAARHPGSLSSVINTAIKPTLALAYSLLSVAALGDVVIPRQTVQNYVNIRVAPEAGSDVIEELRHGEQVQLIESSERWHEVLLADGRKGFISQLWTEVVAAPPAAESATAATKPPDDAVAAGSNARDSRPVPQASAAGPAQADSDTAGEPAGGESAASSDEPRTAAVAPEGESPAVSAAEAEPEPAAESRAAGESSPHSAAELESLKLTTAVPAASGSPTQHAREPDDERLAESIDAAEGQPDEQADTDEPQNARRRPQTDALPAVPTIAAIEGTPNYLTKFTGPATGGDSQLFDDGINVGIGTAEPEEPLDVNGNVQIYNRNSNIAVLSLKQSTGETGYITHNRAGTLIIGAGSEDRITIDGEGNVGIGMNRMRHALEMASGAHVTAGGVWTNASSRDSKQNIEELTLAKALSALETLAPVTFSYKVDPKDSHVGFIAEDAPELVASKDRRGLSSMDIVAVLTRVVQAQQQRIDALESRLEAVQTSTLRAESR